jgi:hypothetical protein
VLAYATIAHVADICVLACCLTGMDIAKFTDTTEETSEWVEKKIRINKNIAPTNGPTVRLAQFVACRDATARFIPSP